VLCGICGRAVEFLWPKFPGTTLALTQHERTVNDSESSGLPASGLVRWSMTWAESSLDATLHCRQRQHCGSCNTWTDQAQAERLAIGLDNPIGGQMGTWL
jgi:hypothetical protein